MCSVLLYALVCARTLAHTCLHARLICGEALALLVSVFVMQTERQLCCPLFRTVFAPGLERFGTLHGTGTGMPAVAELFACFKHDHLQQFALLGRMDTRHEQSSLLLSGAQAIDQLIRLPSSHHLVLDETTPLPSRH